MTKLLSKHYEGHFLRRCDIKFERYGKYFYMKSYTNILENLFLSFEKTKTLVILTRTHFSKSSYLSQIRHHLILFQQVLSIFYITSFLILTSSFKLSFKSSNKCHELSKKLI